MTCWTGSSTCSRGFLPRVRCRATLPLTPPATRLHHWRRPRWAAQRDPPRAAAGKRRSLLAILGPGLITGAADDDPRRNRHLFAGRGPVRLLDRLGHAVHLAADGVRSRRSARASAASPARASPRTCANITPGRCYTGSWGCWRLPISSISAPIWARWPMRCAYWSVVLRGFTSSFSRRSAPPLENFSKYQQLRQNPQMADVSGAVRLCRGGARRQGAVGRSRP